ncbi:hypothetical protein MHYP_G00051510 [Metynnis hypsauchen]
MHDKRCLSVISDISALHAGWRNDRLTLSLQAARLEKMAPSSGERCKQSGTSRHLSTLSGLQASLCVSIEEKGGIFRHWTIFNAETLE